MRRQGWVRVRRESRRERLFRLTQAGKRKVQKLNLIGAAEQRMRENLAMRVEKHDRRLGITEAATAA